MSKEEYRDSIKRMVDKIADVQALKLIFLFARGKLL